MTRHFLHFLALALLAGCTSSKPASSSVAQQQSEWLADSTCGFDRTPLRTDPNSLAQDFVRRDASGAFLQTDTWFAQVTTCPDHEPGPDAHDAVAGYRVRKGLQTDTLVQYMVDYAQLGRIEYRQDANGQYRAVWTPRIEEFPETLTVVRTSYGWRIRSPALWQHVLADTVLHRLRVLPPTNAIEMQHVLDSLRALGWHGGA